ncbi:MAG: hypothetical protein JXA15_08520 [Spirochaetales bacterium]|nr:hypothetical protein [Spirochaetales bacterium]
MKRAGLSTVGKSWFSNQAAEECANLPWLLVAALLLASTLALALPFAAGRWREAREFSASSGYPGLGSAFLALARQGGEWRVGDGALLRASGGPDRIEAAGWTILFGEIPEGRPVQATLALAPEAISVYHPSNDWLLRTSWAPFEGLDSDALRAAAADRAQMAALVEGVLWTAAAARLPADLVMLVALFAVQFLFFVLVLGLFLSLSALRRKPADDGTRERPKPLAAFKVTAAVLSGPAFLAGLAGLAFSGFAAPLILIGFSLLAGVRVVLVYAARYRAAARRVASEDGAVQ